MINKFIDPVHHMKPGLLSGGHSCKQQCGPRMSKAPNHSISLEWTSDIPQHTVRYQVTSLANMRLSHSEWHCCRGGLWISVCSGNRLTLTVLFHSEQWDVSARRAVRHLLHWCRYKKRDGTGKDCVCEQVSHLMAVKHSSSVTIYMYFKNIYAI